MQERFSRDLVASRLRCLESPRRLWIAYSGGSDSHALLHAVATLRGELGLAALRAIHVNHGLLPEAHAWEAHCRTVCIELGVDFIGLRVQVPDGRDGVEAAARRARYAAIERCLGSGDFVLTAHTEDDQAETVLLQLLRGAGPRGLAGMTLRRRLGEGWLIRPLLQMSRASVREYARREGLPTVEDPSNRDSRFDRSFVRHALLVPMRARWPGVSHTLARVASHQAGLAHLLEEITARELPEAGPGGGLSVAILAGMDPARRTRVLRAWPERLGLPPPSLAHLAEIDRCLIRARPDAMPLVQWPGAEARRYRDGIFFMPRLGRREARARVEWRLPEPLRLRHGTLRVEDTHAPGLARWAAAEGVSVRFRQGGERYRPRHGGRSHSLKKLFQEAGIPPWLRSRIPLVYVGEALASVPGLLLCGDFVSGDAEPAWLITWQDDCDVPRED